MGINIGGNTLRNIEDRLKNGVDTVTNATNALITNTMNDVDLILRKVGDCAKAIDSIRVRVTQRAVEYHTKTMDILVQTGLIPVDLIESVYRRVTGQIARDPNPRIYLLFNPREFVWFNQPARWVLINPATHQFRPAEWPYIFIHGAENSTIDDALTFYKSNESTIRMFSPTGRNSPDYINNARIYLVVYDAKLTDDNVAVIQAAFAIELGQAITQPVSTIAPTLTKAVIWREYKRRATETADRVLLPFFNNLAATQITRGGIISHSLGNLVAARAAHRYMTQANSRQLFRNWLSMAAAIPSNAFTNTGEYYNAPRIAGIADDILFGTSVWYSWADIVLSTVYIGANAHTAMGQTGALVPAFPLTDFNVTPYVGIIHSYDPTDPNNESKSYWGRLTRELQRAFQTSAGA